MLDYLGLNVGYPKLEQAHHDSLSSSVKWGGKYCLPDRNVMEVKYLTSHKLLRI